ncbi:MAG: hypothetical protein QNJ64_04425 [Crocosphaera sp.]|nr:hypothetical protein [Crocosphaera sp.]
MKAIVNQNERITSTSSWRLETRKILFLLVDWIWRGFLAIPPPLFIPLKEEAWNPFFGQGDRQRRKLTKETFDLY